MLHIVISTRRLIDEDASFHFPRKLPSCEWSVIHAACSSRPDPANVAVPILTYLIGKEGAPVEDVDSCNQSPLHYAVCHHNAEELTLALLEKGCNANVARNGDGFTPLHLAVMLGKTKVRD